MAQAAGLLDHDQFSCSICLDLLKDPVTIPCGHSYCLGCIKDCWDQNDHTGVYSCPQCRETFTPRPVLRKSTMLAEVVNKLKKTGLQAAPPAHCYAESGDVACDICTGRKCKAVKSCLVCLASYCETHLNLHDVLNPGKRHKLVKATGNLQEKICSDHDKLMEIYCRTDQQCICYLCTMDKHSGHKTVSAAAERAEQQTQLRATQSTFRLRIQEREKELQDLRQAVQSLKRSAQAAVEDSERIFTELIRSIEGRHSEVKEQIRGQEKAEVSRAEGLLKQLEQEIADLRRRDSELEQLSHTEDHIHFLQNFQSLCAAPGPGDLPRITVSPHASFEAVRKSVSELKERLEDVCKGELVNVYNSVKEVQTVGSWTREDFRQLKEVQTVGSWTREDFLQYSCQLTLDQNTINNFLRLTGDNREVSHMGVIQPYRHHPERFDGNEQHSGSFSYSGAYSYTYPAYTMGTQRSNDAQRLKMFAQVLCSECLSERSYWEVEWRGQDYVSIAASYKAIGRKGQGDDCVLGGNDKSWALRCSPSSYAFWHNNESTEIPVPSSSSSRIGVYLDHRAGTLCFYSVSDTMTLLHRVQNKFTQPLYPGFGVGVESYVILENLGRSAATAFSEIDQFTGYTW